MTTALTGCTALVTGSTSGIGRAIAWQLAVLGAGIVVHGRSADRGTEVIRDVESLGVSARFVAADLARPDGVRQLAQQAGPIDILINNAGVYGFAATASTDDTFFDDHVNINLRAPYILVQQLVPDMAARGCGAVVNLSTVAASTPARTAGVYGATKAGLELLTKVWADEFGPSGVRINAVAAGPTVTPGTRTMPRLVDALAETTALGRAADAEEIAAAVAFLASPAASYINGAVLHATGGAVAIAP
ncbi:SDR family NAD(P)-dependent oxidoreductase [Mycobacterium sp. 3519A]|uniref:SDR family NAD(P)-dependent oxidoreductase n=1 Tax=Mycobacterium sp. 3519A TaxID=2057184 RepID=UPI000C7D6B66|nr:SDR family oxidoreductase [Mycobacterium sp. 3519A]